MTPLRLQLSRTKGFRLHQASFAANGLDCRRVDRTTMFGNPYRHQDIKRFMTVTSDEETAARDVAALLVAMFRAWLTEDPVGRYHARVALDRLRGHNLACWCRLDRPCHADVLLEVVNG